MSSAELAHLPFLVPLRRSLEEYEKQHGHLPSGLKDQRAIEEAVKRQLSKLSQQTTNTPNDPNNDHPSANFDEAVRYLNKILAPGMVDDQGRVKLASHTQNLFALSTKYSLIAACRLKRQILENNITTKKRRTPQLSTDEFTESCAPATSAAPCSRQPTIESKRSTIRDALLFWVTIDCLRMFHEEHGVLPLCASIPDITSDSASYSKLQRIFKDKFTKDFEAVRQAVCNRLDEVATSAIGSPSLESTSPNSSSVTAVNNERNLLRKVADRQRLPDELEARATDTSCILNAGDEDRIKVLCKFSTDLQRIDFPTIKEEYRPDAIKAACNMNLTDEDDSEFWWYLMLCCAERFRSEHHRWPGEFKNDDDATRRIEKDIVTLLDECRRLLLSMNITQLPPSEEESVAAGVSSATGGCITEDSRLSKRANALVNGGNTELHCISAMIGGVAAQEAIKLLTQQFVPLNHTFIYNGITCKGQVFGGED